MPFSFIEWVNFSSFFFYYVQNAGLVRNEIQTVKTILEYLVVFYGKSYILHLQKKGEGKVIKPKSEFCLSTTTMSMLK